MEKTYKATEIQKGFHPAGYRIEAESGVFERALDMRMASIKAISLKNIT